MKIYRRTTGTQRKQEAKMKQRFLHVSEGGETYCIGNNENKRRCKAIRLSWRSPEANS